MPKNQRSVKTKTIHIDSFNKIERLSSELGITKSDVYEKAIICYLKTLGIDIDIQDSHKKKRRLKPLRVDRMVMSFYVHSLVERKLNELSTTGKYIEQLTIIKNAVNEFYNQKINNNEF